MSRVKNITFKSTAIEIILVISKGQLKKLVYIDIKSTIILTIIL